MPLRLMMVAILLGLLPGSTLANEPAEKQNIIVILADDLGARDLGCYGSNYHKTPNLDRLAKSGARFTDFYAASPVCSPTRASLMTGHYPARLNLTDWLPGRSNRSDQKFNRPMIAEHMPPMQQTLAKSLKNQGYATGLIGKWHLGGAGFGPERYGFDVNIGGDHLGTPRSYFSPYRDATGTMPGLEVAPPGEYLTDRLNAEAVRFLEKNRSQSFFLYLAHFAPHTPMCAKPEIVAKYKGTLQGGRQSNPIYAAMLESLDEGIGRILRTLDELKLAEKTIVIFTSDNGGLATREGPDTPATSNAPWREGKGYLYEGGIRVPLLVRWQG